MPNGTRVNIEVDIKKINNAHPASLEGDFFKGNKHMSYITEKPFLR